MIHYCHVLLLGLLMILNWVVWTKRLVWIRRRDRHLLTPNSDGWIYVAAWLISRVVLVCMYIRWATRRLIQWFVNADALCGARDPLYDRIIRHPEVLAGALVWLVMAAAVIISVAIVILS